MLKKSIIALLLFLSFFFLAMINISLLQNGTINYEVLEENILSFMFFIGLSLSALLVYHLVLGKIDFVEQIKNSYSYHLHVILTFLIPNLFYYNIYFSTTPYTELFYSIFNFALPINFMFFNFKIFSKKNIIAMKSSKI